MKIKDILLEKISLSQYREDIIKRLESSIENTIRQTALGDYDHFTYGIPENEIENYSKESHFGPIIKNLKKEYERRLKSNIETNIHKQTSLILQNTLGYIPQFYIEVNPKLNTRGSANVDIIEISGQYYMPKLMSIIINTTADYIYDNIKKENENVVEVVMRAIKSLAKNKELLYRRIINDSDLKKILNEMTGTITHEIVHLIQFQTQAKKGRQDFEYRSYLEPDKEKFHAHIRKIYDAPGGEDGELKYKLHASSPQEIAAHAHNVVLTIIDDYGLDEIKNIEEYTLYVSEIKDQDIKNSANEYLRHFDPSIPKEKLIRQRYMKLIYQELQEYLNKIKSKIEKK